MVWPPPPGPRDVDPMSRSGGTLGEVDPSLDVRDGPWVTCGRGVVRVELMRAVAGRRREDADV